MSDIPEMSERERLARKLADVAEQGQPVLWQGWLNLADHLLAAGWHHTRAQPVADERAAEALADVEDEAENGTHKPTWRKHLRDLAAALRAALGRVAELEACREQTTNTSVRLVASYKDRLTTATATIAELTADRDEWLAQYGRAKDGLARQLARAEAAEQRERELIEALIWCSGARDFQIDGQAHAGWLKVCKPLLARATLTTEPTR